MTASIPASALVSVIAGVISAGGASLQMNGLCLSESNRVPVGQVLQFPSAASVGAYFGTSSTEAQIAAIYFAGYDNSHVKPGALLFAQYVGAPVSAYLRGGNVSALTLAQLQALTGVLTVTVDGTVHTSATINLAAATSFSNAATLILAGFTAPGFTVTYDSVSGGFILTSSTTGATSTIGFGSGTLSAGLALTSATGAVTSQGAIASVPATFMGAITANTQNWASFFLAFDPDGGSGNTQKLAFAAWVNTTGNRYAFIDWDTDITPTASTNAAASQGQILQGLNSSGTCLIYGTDWSKAAFISGAIASLDFTQLNGRATFAFRSQTGLGADVTSQTIAQNLLANSYNFYGAYATANQGFTFFQNGSVTGPFKWLDTYVGQVYLNNALQLALMNLLVTIPSIPYNQSGYGLIRQACMDPINNALNFGTIRAGVTLSALQIAEVNNAAGLAIDKVLSSAGWYLQILDATAQTRGLRQSPPMTLWYMDGGAVQQINLASVVVQ